MNDPDALLELFVNLLRDIPALVALVDGDPGKIYGYFHEYPTAVNRLEAVSQMKTPSVMVAHDGTTISNRSGGIDHRYLIFPKPTGKVGPMFAAIREGVVTTGGLKLKLTPISTCHPPDIQGCYARSLLIGEGLFLDFHEMPVSLTERGVDN